MFDMQAAISRVESECPLVLVFLAQWDLLQICVAPSFFLCSEGPVVLKGTVHLYCLQGSVGLRGFARLSCLQGNVADGEDDGPEMLSDDIDVYEWSLLPASIMCPLMRWLLTMAFAS